MQPFAGDSLREIDGWRITLTREPGGTWTARASSWCDSEEAEGPSAAKALERLADLIRVDLKPLLREGNGP